MKKVLIALAVCAASFAFAQNQNTGAAATQQAAAPQAKETVAESLADLKLGSKVLDRFSASVTVGYESEYVFRGVKEAGHSVCPQVDFGYDFGAGFAAYVGYWGNYEAGNDSEGFSETDLYIGATYTIKNVTFDVGVINYIYNEDVPAEWEWKAAVSYDTSDIFGEDYAVKPAIAYYYNMELDTSTVELGLEYSAPIMKWINGDNWLTLDSSIMYGYICRRGTQAKEYSGDYGYIQLKSDVVVAITDYCAWSLGIRYSWASNNGTRGSGPYASPYNLADESSNVWFGTAISFGF
jgi:hypothetical protein